MTSSTGSRRHTPRSLFALALGVVLLVVGALPATSAPAPVLPPPVDTVTADALPTVQIDGVVWSQTVIGNIVYAGGQFSNARPAGAAPGTNLTPRHNLLAYNITTGALVTGFAPTLNAQVLSVTASPDGSRLYVAGDFTTVNGVSRYRVAAINPTNGALITAFNPVGVTAQARAVTATADTVYVGGGFLGTGNGQLRNNLAAFRASDGALLPWNPNADYTVWGLSVTADGAWVFAGGSFKNVGGQSAYGLAKIGGSGTGTLDTTWRPVVRNAGTDAGVSSIRVQGSFVYGTTWHFGPGGNLEGTFKVPVANGNVEWVTDCHGDNYSAFLTRGIVYTASHAHYCGNMGGGFPQYPQWRFQHAQAWSDTVTGDILNDVHNYTNWHGIKPGPAMVSWLPDMAIGTYTGQHQAGWTVAGNADYVVYGGEFPTVNGVGQQGLVRFGRRPVAPAREGPHFVGNTLVPRLVPRSTTALRVSWPAGYDRDSYTLTYSVIRDGVFATPRFTTSANSNWWTLPALGFVETGLTPGARYTYQIVARDPDGNTVYGAVTSVTMPTSWGGSTAYAQALRNNGARIYWPMNETSGLTINDRAARSAASTLVGVTDGRGDTGINWNQPGAITGDSAAQLTDNDWSRVYALGTETAPDTFTIQTWVRTTTTRGGRIFGFGDLQNGTSGHRDRMLYMDNAGHVIFGVRAQNNTMRTLSSPSTYNNNQWHMVSASMSPTGMQLYVDGVLVGQRTDTTQGEAYLGYWRIGGDNLNGWPGQPSTRNFVGWVDEIAVYPTALSASQVLGEYQLRNGGFVNQPPSAAFTWSASGLTASVNGTSSSDADGTIVRYAWTFGDGGTATGATASHTYASAGTYPVTLTVTDDDGATNTVTHQVTVSAPPPAGVLAADSFSRTVTGGWGTADTGGPWTVTTATTNFAVTGGAGTIRLAAGSGPSAYLGTLSEAGADVRTSLGFDKPATGGGIYSSVVARRTGTSDYRLKTRVTATDTTIYLARTVNGAETILTTQPVAGLVLAGGDVLYVRLLVSGTNPTTLSAKVWRGGATEPTAWMTTTTDSTASLQAAGGVGFYSYLSASATNAPITQSVLDLTVTRP